MQHQELVAIALEHDDRHLVLAGPEDEVVRLDPHAQAAVDHAAQVGDGLRRPAFALQPAGVDAVGARIVGALRDQLETYRLSLLHALTVREAR